jgi:hypothetical protein
MVVLYFSGRGINPVFVTLFFVVTILSFFILVTTLTRFFMNNRCDKVKTER